MFIINGINAILYMRNRNKSESYYDDEDIKKVPIKVCPFGVDKLVSFGLYTVPEATGYFMVHRRTDVDIGDQIKFNKTEYSVLKVQECWIFNRIEFKVIAVK